tara:strand:+ start:180 stop:476 length:297 start_codon:yes stop_codon:yes gene_type:complete
MKDSFKWLGWLNSKWNKHETFNSFELGKTPEQVAEDFIKTYKRDFVKLVNSLDKDDFDTLEEMQKLVESESHLLRILNEEIKANAKIRYVDFKKKIRL